MNNFKTLTNNELLAILLTDTVTGKQPLKKNDILEKFQSWQKIFQINLEEWLDAGFNPDDFYRIQACFEINSRFLLDSLKKISLNNSHLVKQFLLQQLKGQATETFCLLLLDSRYQLIHFHTISQDKTDMAQVNTRDIIKIALNKHAKSLILAHNHPSGSLDISQADKRTTKKLQKALHWIDVKILDHILIADNQTLSFAEQGLI